MIAGLVNLSTAGAQYGAAGVAVGNTTGFAFSVLFMPFDGDTGDTDIIIDNVNGFTGYRLSIIRDLGAWNVVAAFGNGGALTAVNSETLFGLQNKWCVITCSVVDQDVEMFLNGNLIQTDSLPATYTPAAGATLVTGQAKGALGGIGYTGATALPSDDLGCIQALNVMEGGRFEYISQNFGWAPGAAETFWENCWTGQSAVENGIIVSSGTLNSITDTWLPSPNGGSIPLTRLAGANPVYVLQSNGHHFAPATNGPVVN